MINPSQVPRSSPEASASSPTCAVPACDKRCEGCLMELPTQESPRRLYHSAAQLVVLHAESLPEPETVLGAGQALKRQEGLPVHGCSS